MEPLPALMVAPNGARRTRADHPALPVSIEQTVLTAKACHAAGADGLHLHVRDQAGAHILDAGLYGEAIQELQHTVPGMRVQITTEAVGCYTPAQQRQLVRDCEPASVSVSVAELSANAETRLNIDFYNECQDRGIAVQHILYEPADLVSLVSLFPQGLYADQALQLLFVLGRYSVDQQSRSVDLIPFTDVARRLSPDADWAVCAFGIGETACLQSAHEAGGKLRVGFENSLWHADGRLAADNAERVAVARSIIDGRN
ncbi:MAG: 3-keto-5-aminohexanoate cleavage protein [Granulosicoccus sp.]|nr:3-keto-5-aminohexanoate cleavage protein [Granulosicoccus sp.]